MLKAEVEGSVEPRSPKLGPCPRNVLSRLFRVPPDFIHPNNRPRMRPWTTSSMASTTPNAKP